jgi:hypothetical protein
LAVGVIGFQKLGQKYAIIISSTKSLVERGERQREEVENKRVIKVIIPIAKQGV